MCRSGVEERGKQNQPKLCVCRVERRLNCIVLLIPKPLERLVEIVEGVSLLLKPLAMVCKLCKWSYSHGCGD